MIVGGANNMLQPEEVGVARDLIARAKIVVCQLEIKTETTLASLKMAKQLGGKDTTMNGACWNELANPATHHKNIQPSLIRALPLYNTYIVCHILIRYITPPPSPLPLLNHC